MLQYVVYIIHTYLEKYYCTLSLSALAARIRYRSLCDVTWAQWKQHHAHNTRFCSITTNCGCDVDAGRAMRANCMRGPFIEWDQDILWLYWIEQALQMLTIKGNTIVYNNTPSRTTNYDDDTHRNKGCTLSYALTLRNAERTQTKQHSHKMMKMSRMQCPHGRTADASDINDSREACVCVPRCRSLLTSHHKLSSSALRWDFCGQYSWMSECS